MAHQILKKTLLTATLIYMGVSGKSHADEGNKPFAHSAAYFGAEAGIRKIKSKGDQQIRLGGASDFQKFDISRNVGAGGVFIGYKEIKENFMHGLEISVNLSQSRLKKTLVGTPGGPYSGRKSVVSLKRYTVGPASLTFGIPIATRLLPYVKAGACVGYFDAKHTEGSTSKRKFKWKMGLLLGTGLEVAVTHKISGRVEFKYEKFSRYRTRELATTPAGISIKQVHDPSSMSLQAGLLYHVTPKSAI